MPLVQFACPDCGRKYTFPIVNKGIIYALNIACVCSFKFRVFVDGEEVNIEKEKELEVDDYKFGGVSRKLIFREEN